MKHRFDYNWSLKDTTFTKDKGTVFSCFSAGGGSSLGYKLAGFDVIGCLECDKKMMKNYLANNQVKYPYMEMIQDFKKRTDLPKELFNLAVLDGAPPCSNFSIAGNREKDWGKEKKFAEGQKLQVLDTLFFDFIDLAKKLQPKVVISENVLGIIQGNAKQYSRNIYKEFDKAGYYCQHFVLNASKMGVPQKRIRVFFICLRKDLATPFLKRKNLFQKTPELNLVFNETPILFKEVYDGKGKQITEYLYNIWKLRILKDTSIAATKVRCNMKYNNFSSVYIKKENVPPTIVSSENNHILYDKSVKLSDTELIKISSFPKDYKFQSNVNYIVGMSVPPVMMANIATEIYNQWLSKIL